MKLFEMLQGKFQDMSSREAYSYILKHGRTPELEDIVATDANFSYDYACYDLNSRFPKGEKEIATDAEVSYLYAHNVLGNRFYKGEKVIIKNPLYAYWYAKDILGRRWLRAEPIIKNSVYWKAYKRYFNIK